MAEALRGATAKFRDTMGELRGMTGQIQRELEATRAELRRGVVELPQETQETAANMRRVVADQIRALNELSALVSRSNRVVDAAPAVQPRRVNEAPAAAASVALAAAVEQRVVAPAPAPTPVPAPRVARQVEAKPAPAPAPAPSPAPAPAVRPQAAQPAAPSPAPRREEAPAPQAATRGGWLSDLLNRASRDENAEPNRTVNRGAERTRANSLESLDSISVDIARMIDHDAAVELWDRYKRGEHNVFTRRLYTLQGQQTFDEIRRKYQAEPEFRQTVDRYVEEFERLLAEVSRDDRDSMLTKTYLTSETGKVYTMLAHASGRFD
jgi:hypothetical protein